MKRYDTNFPLGFHIFGFLSDTMSGAYYTPPFAAILELPLMLFDGLNSYSEVFQATLKLF
jgi:hypothetical protein